MAQFGCMVGNQLVKYGIGMYIVILRIMAAPIDSWPLDEQSPAAQLCALTEATTSTPYRQGVA